MKSASTIATSFVLGLSISFALTPLVRKVALRMAWVDQPHERKMHSKPIPYLGGAAIALAFIAGIVGAGLLPTMSAFFTPVGAIVGGAILMGQMGLWDDVRLIPGWVKVPVEIALGVALYFADSAAQLFDLWPLDLVLTVGWVVGITNAVNYMDNMDGLAAGVVAIAGSFYLLLALISEQILLAGISAAVIGSALGFLWHNRFPARIFMGDSGSLFLGFLLAGIGLELRFENIPKVSFLVPVAVLAVPIVDALMVSVSRVQRGLSPILPGKDHLSHRIVRMGLQPRTAVASLWLASVICGGVALTMARSQSLTVYFLMGAMIVACLLFGRLLLRVHVN